MRCKVRHKQYQNTMHCQGDELFPQLYRCLKRDLQILAESEELHILLLRFLYRKINNVHRKKPPHRLVYKLSSWDGAAMGMQLIYVIPYNDWLHRGQETQHWLMWKLTTHKKKKKAEKLSSPKSAKVRLSQECKIAISSLITWFELWDKKIDDYCPEKFFIPHPWKCSSPSCIGLLAIWYSGGFGTKWSLSILLIQSILWVFTLLYVCGTQCDASS